jgi:hypothetical protein
VSRDTVTVSAYNVKRQILPEKQLGSILLVIYSYVTRCIKEEGISGATPDRISSFMQERAKESPQAMALLQCTYFYEMFLIIRRSERQNNHDIFFSAARLILPIYCATPAATYVRICCDVLRYLGTQRVKDLSEGLSEKEAHASKVYSPRKMALYNSDALKASKIG